MKNIIPLLLICTWAACADEPGNKTSDTITPATAPPGHPWFSLEKIDGSTWKISDNQEDNIYLLTGDNKALLIDNGIGAVNLVDYVRQLTDLELIVVNTHGHPDHVGSNNQFDTVYAHVADTAAIKRFTNRNVQREMLQFMVQQPIADSLKFTDTLKQAELVPIKSDMRFDLGNRIVEVIHVPGHTPGSICLLDKKSRLLFSGDHIKIPTWLHMQESTSMEMYLSSVNKLRTRSNEFDRILPGHGNALDTAFLGEQTICA